jgi:thymidylate kinase
LLQTKNVAIPMDCSLAVLRAQQKAEENREHEELKRRTLAAYDERAEEEKEIDGTNPATIVSRRRVACRVC